MQPRDLWIALSILCVAAPGHADETVVKADQLFDEGKALLATDLHAACEKFEQSLALNSQAIGTLMNVALCDQKLGRIASAVVKFGEARDRAREQGMDVHLASAEEHLAALEPRLPYLQLTFKAAPLPSTKIVIHDRVIAIEKVANFPIDPGEHTIVVSAPGHLPYQTTIKIAEAERRAVEIPALQRAITVSGTRRTIGKITAVSGVAALGAGVVIGLVARSRFNGPFDSGECRELDDGTLQCDNSALGQTRSARTLGVVGTVVGSVGLVAVGVGAYLWLRSPAEADRRVTVVPQLGPDGAGFVAAGRF